MPGRDNTGPRGLGPMTGRGAGSCVGFDDPGFRHGHRRGWGFHRRQRTTADVATSVGDRYTMDEEIALLREQLKILEGRIARIKDDE